MSSRGHMLHSSVYNAQSSPHNSNEGNCTCIYRYTFYNSKAEETLRITQRLTSRITSSNSLITFRFTIQSGGKWCYSFFACEPHVVPLNCQYDLSVSDKTDIMMYSSVLLCVLVCSCPRDVLCIHLLASLVHSLACNVFISSRNTS